MNRSVLRGEVVPFLAGFGLLVAAAAVADVLLHAFRLAWVGRWLGIPGALLIALSFAYSLRKRGVLRTGEPARLLEQHEAAALAGSLFVLVHAGVHVHALLPWLAVGAMLVNVASGFTGRLLLGRARRRVATRGEALLEAGRSPAAVERALWWDSVTVDMMKQWRAVHLPITTAFVALALAHVLAALLLWSRP
jgi:hypothetical protein